MESKTITYCGTCGKPLHPDQERCASCSSDDDDFSSLRFPSDYNLAGKKDIVNVLLAVLKELQSINSKLEENNNGE